MNFEGFLETLPIIGTSLVGIFGVIGAMILIVFFLNKSTNYFEDSRKNNDQ